MYTSSISYCIKQVDGSLVQQGRVKANRAALSEWAKSLPRPWCGAMEATIFSHWIYYHLKPLAAELYMGHPAQMKAISAGKKKSDTTDAVVIADLLRADLVPAVYVLPQEIVALRQIL